MSKVSVSSVVSNLKSTARKFIQSELETNKNLSEAEAVKVVEGGVDSLLSHAGPLGALAEPLVNMFIELDVPGIYAEVVEHALGTKAGGDVMAAQGQAS